MRTINYVTSSSFKQDEARCYLAGATLSDGKPASDHFSFQFRNVCVPETLEVDLVKLVTSEALSAYQQIRVPCIVEHAGLIFEDYSSDSYPGGLTKPMWNTLQAKFIEETHSAGRRAIARAVVGYCDGKSIKTFVGETFGTLTSEARGKREFYWDTVFVPDSTDSELKGMTYAEIVANERYGLTYKMAQLSQSGRAIGKLLSFLMENPNTGLWPSH